MIYDKRVCIVIKWISHYRVPFYDALKIDLEGKGIKLIVLYGEPSSKLDKLKKDYSDLSWGKKMHNISIGSPEGGVLWQPVLSDIKGADLVIVEQANKLLFNYIVQIKRLFTKQKIAFWGHGKNFQNKNEYSVAETIKSFTLKYVDWWFAYNSKSVDVVSERGFPLCKITNVENAIDVNQLTKLSDSISNEELVDFKIKNGINSDVIGVFCGGLYHDKNLPFLLKSAKLIKEKKPEFELIIIGSGPDSHLAEKAENKYEWIHYMGALFNKEKIVAMKVAKVYLMPGLVGLGVLDAFAVCLPVVTTDFKYHSPEISYVFNNENGLVAKNNVCDYCDAVVKLFDDSSVLDRLKTGCFISANHFTIENMVSNFSNGIVECLRN